MIELKHVTFGYNKKQMVLQDINITIPVIGSWLV